MTSLDHLKSVAEGGPAFRRLLARGDVDWERWQRAAAVLARTLPGPRFPDRCLHQLYVPVLLWLDGEVRRSARRPLIVGVSAPQGAGKTTLVRGLIPALQDLGWRVAAISIDDFYLTHADQLRLASANEDNPYLLYRGYPGTHDVSLGTSTIESLRRLTDSLELRLPAYDKSLHDGRGDRLPESAWPVVRGPIDLVLVEGWMLGFQPVEATRTADSALRTVNDCLAGYEAWLRLIDAMVILRTDDVNRIVRWRVAAEEAMRRSGRSGLDPAAAEDYARRFVPAYELYADTVASGRWSPDHQLELFLDEDRLPVTSGT